MDKMARGFVALAFSLTLTVPAFAGIADSPLPVLVAGQPTLHLYSVPGVVDGGQLTTFFSCTSLEKTLTVQVGVEVFFSSGGAPVNDGAATSLSLGPGATIMFATSNANGFSINSNLGAGPIGNGSARILATSKNVACTSFLADSFNVPPTSMVQLTIIAKLKQKAAN